MTRTIEEIKAEVAGVKMALAEGVEVKDIDRYTTEQVETLLKKLPRTKYVAAQDIVQHLITFKDAKRNLNKVKAQMMMKAGSQPDLGAAADRKAWADERPEVEAAEISLIDAEAHLRIAEFLHEAHDDLFTAVKKIASIKIEQDRDAKNANQYGE